MASLITKLKNQAAAVTVDYNFLTNGAKEQPTQKRQVIESRLKKSEANLKKIRLVVPAAANFNTIRALLQNGAVNYFHNWGAGWQPAALAEDKVQEFKATLLMFEEVRVKADVIRPYHVGVKDARFPRFSADFAEKHVADSVQFAQQRAMGRYQANNAISVSTFFLSADAAEFHKEVELLRNAGLFVAIHALFEAKSIKYRLKNKQIRSIVISSKRDYSLLNCTQANGFVPQPFQREVYYSFCFVGAKGDFLVNHYIKKADLFTGNDGLVAGWKHVPLDKLLKFSGMEKKRADMEAAVTGAHVARVYVEFGAFEDADLA